MSGLNALHSDRDLAALFLPTLDSHDSLQESEVGIVYVATAVVINPGRGEMVAEKSWGTRDPDCKDVTSSHDRFLDTLCAYLVQYGSRMLKGVTQHTHSCTTRVAYHDIAVHTLNERCPVILIYNSWHLDVMRSCFTSGYSVQHSNNKPEFNIINME